MKFMKREDLKEGMIIEERDGGKYYIGKNDKIYELNSDKWWSNIFDYNENLTYGNYDNCWGDIVKIYDENMNLLWERGDDIKQEVELTNEQLKLYKSCYENYPIQFMETYLGIKLTFWQKSILNKVINELDDE